jgi:25S rRNA (uracil2843-N3)-methyltransferase
MGKNGRFQKAYGKVVGERSHDNRPGWKGPGYQKPKEKAKPKVSPKSKGDEEPETISLVPLELQQIVLNIFRDVFSDVITSDQLKETLQEVKGALYERDFERAFGNKEYLEAYALRWSPVSGMLP